MSKHTDNDNLRNDIYENLPCQAMYNESVRKIHQQASSLVNPNANSIGNCNSTPANHKASSGGGGGGGKEMLYATPLRKSDRYKSGERSRHTAAAEAKLSNYRDSNRLASARNGNAVQVTDLDADKDDAEGDGVDGCASTSALVGGSNYSNQHLGGGTGTGTATATINQQLEDRRDSSPS
ncbi:GL13698 [Drosophila persimilis]|uniref:GL13698 n=1 Tax=Drosophila persimilis TaxID=7234 RepID=B4GP04_DROPE|nr:GL13698 [Drosophila persimilis]